MSPKSLFSHAVRITLSFLLVFLTLLPAVGAKSNSPSLLKTELKNMGFEGIPTAAPSVSLPAAKTDLMESPFQTALKTGAAIAAQSEEVPIVTEAEQMYNAPSASYLAVPSPDGKSVLVGSNGTDFPLIDIETAQIKQVFHTDGWIRTAAFSPDSGSVLLNNTLYDVATGAKLQTFVADDYTSTPQAGDISPDGSKALVLQDKKAYYFDIPGNTLLKTYDYTLNDNLNELGFARFSPDGTQFVIGGARDDGNDAVWVNSVYTATAVFFKQLPDLYSAHSARFSPDGQHLLVAEAGDSGARGKLRRWNIASGAEEYNYAAMNLYNMHDIDVMTTTTQTLIVAGGQPGAVDLKIVDYDTGGVTMSANAYGRVYSVNFVPHSKNLIISTQTNVFLLDGDSGALIRELYAAADYLNDVARSPNGEKIALAGTRGGSDSHPAPLILLSKGGKLLHRFGNVYDANSVAFSPDSRYLLVGTQHDPFGSTIAGQIHLFDVNSYNLARTYNLGAGFENTDILKVAFSSDGTWFVAAGDDDIFIFNTASGAILQHIQYAAGELGGLAISPDDTQIAVGKTKIAHNTNHDSVFLWEAATGQLLKTFKSDWTWDVAFSPDGSKLAAAGGEYDSLIKVWDIASGAELKSFNPDHGVSAFAVAFSPDGNWLLTGGDDLNAKLWDYASGKLLRKFEHTYKVNGVKFTPDGKRILTWQSEAADSRGGAGRLWNLDVAPIRQPITTLSPGVTQSGNVTQFGWADYVIETPANANLLITATLPSSASLRLYGRLAEQPTLGFSDYQALEKTVDGSYQLLIPNAQAGKYYIGVYGDSVTGAQADFSIKAQFKDRHLADLNPRSAGNAGDATLQLSGLGFETSGMTAALYQNGVEKVTANSLSYQTSSALAATFNLSGTAAGTYDLRLIWSDNHTEELKSAVVITNGVGAQLQSDLIIPPFHRPDRQYAAQIRYQNAGDSNMNVPLYRLSANSNARLMCGSGVYTGAVQALGVPSSGDARLLPPGGEGQISLKYTGLQESMDFQLSVLFPTAAPINWADHKASMRPAYIDQPEWDNIFPSLTGQLGATWRDYLTVLGNNAQRLRQRGDIAYCVGDQLDLEIRKARGLPTAAIAGTLRNAETQKALGSVMMTAYNAAGNFYRAETNFASGHFTLKNLPTGVYTLTAEGYYFSPTLSIQISNDTDVTDRDFSAYPVPEADDEADPVVLAANHFPVLSADAQGNAVMVWQRYGQLWTAEYSPTAKLWHHSGVVSGTVGEAPALAYGGNLANGNPGFVAVWRSGSGNSGQLHYSIIARSGDGSLQWSEPITLTNLVTGTAGDTAPAIVAPDNGKPLALWLRKNWEIQDDTDLYSQQFTPPPPQKMRMLVIVPAAELEEFSRSPLAPLAEHCVGVTLKEGESLPSWVPLIGGKYGFEVVGSACGEVDCDLSVSGGLEVGVDFSDRVSGSGSASVSAAWETNNQVEPCKYAFTQGTLGLSVGAEGKIPAFVFSIPLFAELEVGGAINGEVAGSVAWKGGNFPGYPSSGEVELTAGVGPYGTATFVKVVEAEVKGSGQVKGKYSTPPSKFSFEGWCMNLNASAKVWILSYSFDKSWGPACTDRMPLVLRAAQNNSRQTMLSVSRSTQDNVPVTETLLVQVEAQTGTGNIYTGANLAGSPVLSATIAADLTNDGAPAVARSSNGEILVAWTKDSADQHSSVGSSVVVAQTNGLTFTLPVTVDGSSHFNKHADIAFTGAVTPMVVWAGADASSVSLSSTYTDVINAINDSDIYYSRRISGTWSAPAKVASIGGSDENTHLASDGNGSAAVVWTHRHGENDDELYAALWNGGSWASAVPIDKQAGVIESLDVIYTGVITKTPLLVWAQDTDGNAETLNDLAIFYSVYSATTWTAPTMLNQATTLQAGESSRQPQQDRLWNQAPLRSPCAARGVGFPNPPYPPSSCCPKKEEETPPTPPEPPAPVPAPQPVAPPDENGSNGGSYSVGGHTSASRTSNDPNEKVGLAGWDGAGSVISNTRLIYTIFFENVLSGTLTVPAQEVFVSDQLSDKLDWSTLRFEEVAFGDTVLPLESAGSGFQTQAQAADYRYPATTTWTVDVSGQIDDKGKIDWTFRTLDPATGLLPTDVDAGFLPVNDATGRGEGHVTFSVEQRPNLTAGTVITNMANIVFDTNEAVVTNIYTNTIGRPIIYLPLVMK